MYIVGQEEIDAIAKVLLSGKMFRYGIGGECCRFEQRYGDYLGSKHVMMTSSGSAALQAALVSQGIGPGDEVLVPACTYIATAIAVLAVGAIPVVVDIDESLTMSPEAMEAAITPNTRAAIPVHMWGLVADMDPIMAIARKHGMKIIEDACQCVGGGYRGRKAGAIGDAGAFSFNYYKNMTCGEGGAVVTNDDTAAQRMGCMIDCCRFYWEGRENGVNTFCAVGSRPSEFEGAIMNVQLDRLPNMIAAMRTQKIGMLQALADTGLKPIKANSLECECGTSLGFLLPSVEAAEKFQEQLNCGFIAANTGRHIYTEWDPIITQQGAHCDAMNPYKMKENQGLRLTLTKDQCPVSLDILKRSVLVGMHPTRSADEVDALTETIRKAAKCILG